MSSSRDPSKQAQEVLFSGKISKVYHPPLSFNNSTFQQISTHKHLGIHLNEELTFKHNNEKINKADKGIGNIRKLNKIVPCSALLTILPIFCKAPS